MKCPKCKKPGYTPPLKGRPREINDEMVYDQVVLAGWSVTEVARKFGLSEPGIRKSIKRFEKENAKR